jgi:hypothetical protein
MAYWPFPNGMNGIAPAYFQAKIDEFLFKTYLQSSPFTMLSGSNDSNAISVKGIENSKGGAAVFGRLQPTDFTRPILNDDQVRGIDRFQKTDTMLVDADKITFKLDRRNISIEEFASKIHLTQNQAQRLAEDHRQYKDLKIFQSAMTGLYTASVPGSAPQVARAIAGNIVAGQAADGIYTYANNVTLPDSLAASMPLNRAAQHKMSWDHIQRLLMLSKTRYSGTDPLQPMSVTQFNGWDAPKYMLYMTSTAANNLKNDPKFIEYNYKRSLNLPGQGNPIIGGEFIGRVGNCECIEVTAMNHPLLYLPNADGTPNTVEWSLMFGRGAWGMFQKTGLTYIEETDKVEDSGFHLARQFMGVKPLIFPNSLAQPIEQGIIHSFTRS